MAFGDGGAQDRVKSIQDASTSLQNSMLIKVDWAIGELLAAGVVSNDIVVQDFIPPSPMPLISSPIKPSIPDFSVTEPSRPTSPGLENFTVSPVTIPNFSVSPPSIVFPSFSDITFPAAPGAAPIISDVSIPVEPSYVIPSPPSWDDFDIPAMPAYVTPNFEGTRPTLPAMSTPGQVFFYEESSFSPALWAALQDQLMADIQGGGDVTNILAMAGMFAEQERWVTEQGVQRKEVIAATWRAKGYVRLPGPAQAQLRLVDLDVEKSLAATKTQAVAKQAEMSLTYRQFLLQQAGGLVANVELAQWNASNNRAVEAAKLTAEFIYQDLDARVKLFNTSLALFQADASVLEAKIKASLGALDAYKTSMEGAKVRGELRDSDVKAYLGQLQGVGQVVEIYKGRLQGAQVSADVQKSRMQAYETQIQAYTASVNAVRAQYDARVAQITGEKAKADVYDSQVRAYTAQLGGAKTVAEISSIQAGIVADKNKSAATMYQADVDAYRANWQGISTQVEGLSKKADAIAKVYSAEIQGVSGENDSRIRKFVADVQSFSAQTDAAIKEAGLILDGRRYNAEIQERAAAAIAQVSGQGLAAALQQIHGTASLGYSENDGRSESTSESKSESKSESTSKSTVDSTSESNSTSYSTNYNYNKSLSA